MRVMERGSKKEKFAEKLKLKHLLTPENNETTVDLPFPALNTSYVSSTPSGRSGVHAILGLLHEPT